ncbi:MAG TPA: ABC transporter permease [Bacillota bacterium]|nr:ABC transporter permease [Bacillota bacterium]
MGAYVAGRLLHVLPVVIGVSLLVFLIGHLTPGDPVALMFGLEAGADPELMASIRRELGLDQPLHIQYLRFLGGLARGDLGRSIRTGDKVVREIQARLPATAELALSALLISVAIGVTAGVISAAYRNSGFDYASTFGALFGVSVPAFWLGLMLMYFLAVRVPLFPVSGRAMPLVQALGLSLTGEFWQFGMAARHLVLPAITLGLPSAALVARLTRSAMLEVLGQDYVRTARAKGLGERTVLYRHALRNAMIPVVTMVGLQFGFLLGGAVITESVFAWPGIGRLVVQAIQQRDFPLAQGIVMIVALIFVLVNLLVDLAYGALDPRVRYR